MSFSSTHFDSFFLPSLRYARLPTHKCARTRKLAITFFYRCKQRERAATSLIDVRKSASGKKSIFMNTQSFLRISMRVNIWHPGSYRIGKKNCSHKSFDSGTKGGNRFRNQDKCLFHALNLDANLRIVSCTHLFNFRSKPTGRLVELEFDKSLRFCKVLVRLEVED